MQTQKRWATGVQAPLTKMGCLLPNPKRASAAITLDQDKWVLRRTQLQLATLAVESFGRLGKEGIDLIDQVAASIVGGTGGAS